MGKLPTGSLISLGSSSIEASAETSFDYIVVGGGTAGCVLASRLSSADGNPSVLLLERGQAHDSFTSRVPLLSTANQTSPTKSLQFKTVPQPGLNGKTTTIPGGKMLGGSSRINSSIYTRGSPAEFDRWASEFNLPDWDWKGVLPFFVKSQGHDSSIVTSNAPDINTNTSSTPSQLEGHTGTNGPWRTSKPSKLIWPSAISFFRSAQSIGIPFVEDLSDPKGSANSVAVHTLTGNQGERLSTYDAYLKPGSFGTGLRVGLGAVVSKVEIDEVTKRAIGIWFEDEKKPGHKLFAAANKEIILTAGAMISPQILLLSGIGPSSATPLTPNTSDAYLSPPADDNFGIKKVVELPVGEGLQDHIGVYLPYQVPYGDSLDRIESSPFYAMKQLGSYMLSRYGAFTFQGAHGAIFTSSSLIPRLLSSSSTYSKANPLVTSQHAVDEIPNIEILPLPMRMHASMDDGKPDGDTDSLMKGQYDKSLGYFTPIVVNISPLSTGSLKLRSSNPLDLPLVDPAYLARPEDVKVIIEGMKLVKKLTTTMASEGYAVKAVGPNFPFSDGEEDDTKLEEYARTWSAPCYHVSSTCRMSGIEGDGVVDAELKVKGGIKGLRVSDASVFPRTLSAHCQAATVMVAEKCAAMILAELQL